MKPWLGVALFSLTLAGSFSLKERRHVVRSLVDRAKKHYNISVADLGPDGVWDRADLAVSCVSSSLRETEHRLSQVRNFLEKAEADGEFEITDARQEVFSYGDI